MRTPARNGNWSAEQRAERKRANLVPALRAHEREADQRELARRVGVGRLQRDRVGCVVFLLPEAREQAIWSVARESFLRRDNQRRRAIEAACHVADVRQVRRRQQLIDTRRHNSRSDVDGVRKFVRPSTRSLAHVHNLRVAKPLSCAERAGQSY